MCFAGKEKGVKGFRRMNKALVVVYYCATDDLKLSGMRGLLYYVHRHLEGVQ